MAIDKSKWNTKINVSQKTIDAIKKQGMSASLKKAATSSNASFVEGVKRIYGAGRVGSAGAVAKNANARESRPTSAASNSVSTRSRSRATDINKAKTAAAARTKAKSAAPKASGKVSRFMSAPKPIAKTSRMAANEELSRMTTAKARAAAVSKTSPNNANKRESRPTVVASAPVPRGIFPKTSAEMNANKRESRQTTAAAPRAVGPRKPAASQTRSYTGYPGKPTPSRRSW